MVNSDSGIVNTDSGNLGKSVHVKTGINVHIKPELVFTLARNSCSLCSGICTSEGWTALMISQALRIHEMTVHQHIHDYLKSEKLKPENGALKANFLLSKQRCLLST